MLDVLCFETEKEREMEETLMEWNDVTLILVW